MAVYIHREAKFNKQLKQMERSDKKGLLAANRARDLVTKLLREDLFFLKEKDSLTKHGELRIDKCRKYNLGSGYRLICVKQGQDLIITVVGTHDDCDRWIENNRRFEPELGEVREESLLTKEIEGESEIYETGFEEEMDYDDILRQKIDDKLLREIFSGLTKEGL